MTTPLVDWNKKPELVERVKQLWMEGKPGSGVAKVIADETSIPVTRSMIMGVVHRFKFPRPVVRNRAVLEHRIIKEKPKRRRSVPPDGRRLIDLGLHECRWPLGPELARAEMFCARETYEHQVYCEEHYYQSLHLWRRGAARLKNERANGNGAHRVFG